MHIHVELVEFDSHIIRMYFTRACTVVFGFSANCVVDQEFYNAGLPQLVVPQEESVVLLLVRTC